MRNVIRRRPETQAVVRLNENGNIGGHLTMLASEYNDVALDQLLTRIFETRAEVQIYYSRANKPIDPRRVDALMVYLPFRNKVILLDHCNSTNKWNVEIKGKITDVDEYYPRELIACA